MEKENMNQTVRDEILARLRSARKMAIPDRPILPPPVELSWDRETMIARFTESLAAQTGVVHRVKNRIDALEKLLEIAGSEGLKRIIASTDNVVEPLGLREWGQANGITVNIAADFPDRDAYRDMVFDQADASVTGADFAVVESGTLVIRHDRHQPRLVSLAPILHIAIVPSDRFIPLYENAVSQIFQTGENIPGQVTFITGPSMTADIQATQFKGMHGPRRLVVIIIDEI